MPPRIPRYKPPHSNAPRPSAAKRGYDHAWSKLSKEKRAADPWCEYCIEAGIEPPALAVDVDHVDGDVMNRAWSNLKSTCRLHHNRKTHGRK